MTANTNGRKEERRIRQRGREGEEQNTPHSFHRISSRTTALTHPQQTQHRTDRRETRMMRGGARQHKEDRATRRRGGQHNTHHTALQQGHRINDKGDTNTQTGDTNIRRGVSNTAALHSPCHPPPHITPLFSDGPTLHHDEGGTDRGYPATRTPQTHTPTPQHYTWQRTVHDMTAVLASTAMGRVGYEPHHCTEQDSSSTHHRHSTH